MLCLNAGFPMQCRRDREKTEKRQNLPVAERHAEDSCRRKGKDVGLLRCERAGELSDDARGEMSATTGVVEKRIEP